jgi:hypothetical protein
LEFEKISRGFEGMFMGESSPIEGEKGLDIKWMNIGGNTDEFSMKFPPHLHAILLNLPCEFS